MTHKKGLEQSSRIKFFVHFLGRPVNETISTKKLFGQGSKTDCFKK